jgi:hypothetical protein
MTIETKEQFLEKMLEGKRPECPACHQEMEIWEVPLMACGDGLGWGVPYLFVCFNEACPTYKQGWEHIDQAYGHTASCRNICYPDLGKYECMPVFSAQGATGQIVTEELLVEEDRIREATKQGFFLLAGFYTENSWIDVLRLLLDVTQPARVRLKAAEMMGDIGDPEAVEPLHNFHSGNNAIDHTVSEAIAKIHDRHYTLECPYCAEIIKKRAKVCKHCGKEL